MIGSQLLFKLSSFRMTCRQLSFRLSLKRITVVFFSRACVSPLNQLGCIERAMWTYLDVASVTDMSLVNPACEKGHPLSHDRLNAFLPNRAPACHSCNVLVPIASSAFCCYQCATNLMMQEPTPKGIASRKLYKGIVVCHGCAFGQPTDNDPNDTLPSLMWTHVRDNKHANLSL